VYTRNFISDFFDLFKFVLNYFFIIGSYAHMSQAKPLPSAFFFLLYNTIIYCELTLKISSVARVTCSLVLFLFKLDNF
jgi:hypothetical protein